MPRTVVITGASSGIGRGLAIACAARGDNVVVAARRAEVLQALASELGNAIAVSVDVGEPEGMAQLRAAACEAFGHVDVWVNNAGVGVAGEFHKVPLVDHLRAIKTSLDGVVIGSHLALEHFVARGSGVVINVGSASSKTVLPYYSSYASSKAAVEELGKCLHRELRLNGYDAVHVCTLNPWVVDTPWFEHAGNYTGHELNMPLYDDPDAVVAAILELMIKPRERVELKLSKVPALISKILPGTSDAFSSKVVQQYIDQAPPAPFTSGALHKPMTGGVGVTANLRDRPTL